MKKIYLKNISVFFLASLFVFNGICSSFPQLFSGNEYDIENVLSSETEKKSNSEKAEKELKEFYLNNVCSPYLLSSSLFGSIKIGNPYSVLYIDDISLSIPTPPPKV